MELNKRIARLSEIRKHLVAPRHSHLPNSLREVERICQRTLPDEVVNLVCLSGRLSDDHCPGWLSGYEYEITDPDTLLSLYTTLKHDALGYFGEYAIDEKYEFQGHSIPFWQRDSDEYPDEVPERITNLTRFLPIARHQSDFLVADLDNAGAIYELTFMEEAIVYAPSLNTHIADLIDGLSDGRYRLDEDAVLSFPAWWSDRT